MCGQSVQCDFARIIPAGHSVTATATDPFGNTSEFSALLWLECEYWGPGSGRSFRGTGERRDRKSARSNYRGTVRGQHNRLFREVRILKFAAGSRLPRKTRETGPGDHPGEPDLYKSDLKSVRRIHVCHSPIDTRCSDNAHESGFLRGSTGIRRGSETRKPQTCLRRGRFLRPSGMSR